MVGGGEVSDRNASQEVESFGCAKMRLEYRLRDKHYKAPYFINRRFASWVAEHLMDCNCNYNCKPKSTN